MTADDINLPWGADISWRRIEVRDSWLPLIKEVNDTLLAIDPNYEVSQVKEKFGGLRYYFYPSDSIDEETRMRMRDFVYDAEERSFSIV